MPRRSWTWLEPRTPPTPRLALGLRLAWIGVAVASAVASWLYTGRGIPFEIRSGDALEYAALARRLAAGEGFTAGTLFPAELSFGVSPDHPSLVRPPAWPLLLAGAFRLFGVEPGPALVVVFLCFVGTVLAAGALAAQRAGPVVAALAAASLAATPQLGVYTIDAVTEIPFALVVTLVFLLCARGASPWAIGAACGVAYLTRYNGLVLLVAAAPLVYLRERTLRPVAALGAGVALVVTPWWIRNWIVAGDPLYSLYNLVPWFHPEMPQGFSLNYMVEPDFASEAAMSPLRKPALLLPPLLAHFPLASANLAACVGVALACARGDRLSLGFVAVTAVTVGMVSMAVLRGRYFAPLIPVLVALGAAGWAAHGGRLRPVGLALVLAAPWLPSLPADLLDVQLARIAVERARGPEARLREVGWADCLDGRPLVLAEDADHLHWVTDAIAIKLPGRAQEFWRIVDEYPVEYLQIRRWQPGQRGPVESRFAPVPGCGPELYRRRGPLPADAGPPRAASTAVPSAAQSAASIGSTEIRKRASSRWSPTAKTARHARAVPISR